MREKKTYLFYFGGEGCEEWRHGYSMQNTYSMVENEVQFAFGWSFVCYFTSRSMLFYSPLNVTLDSA